MKKRKLNEKRKIVNCLFMLGCIFLLLSACSAKEKNTDIITQTQENIISNNGNSYSVMEYLMQFDDEKPLIMYNVNGLTKDSEIKAFYVIKNGKCRKYSSYYFLSKYYDYNNIDHDTVTLGDVSKLSDEEILDALDDSYYYHMEDALIMFRVGQTDRLGIAIQEPTYFDIVSYIITDDSGNRPVSEVLVFPKCGIHDYTYVADLNPTDSSPFYLTSYYTSSGIQEKSIYFDTGYGTKDDANEINDYFCFSDNSFITGGVYSSIYFGFDTMKSKWTSKNGIICFRDSNAYVLDIHLDSVSSNLIDYIDPSESDILSIAHSSQQNYYSSFIPADEFTEKYKKK